ncbi:MAG: porin family protein [Prevotella sp.]|nr:porin family protein [Prevotella sp.]
MKKILAIIAIACIGFAMPSQAQVKFGLKGGLNLTALSVDGVDKNLSNKTGFYVGPTVKFTVPVVGLSFDASALYDQRSAKIKGTDETIKAQSIQIPINIRYGVGLSSLVNVFAFAGPQFGFNIGDKSKTLSDITENVKGWTLKSSNLSANIGIGATVLSKLQITANYNFQLGKTGDVTTVEGAASTIFSDSKLKTNSWQLGLGYYF